MFPAENGSVVLNGDDVKLETFSGQTSRNDRMVQEPDCWLQTPFVSFAAWYQYQYNDMRRQR